MKVIPSIDLMNGQVVRLYKGNPEHKTVYSNDPISIAKKWENAGADMIHLVDLDATLGLGSNFELIKKIVSCVSIPVEIGGGLRSESLILDALDIVNRVVIGTFAFKEPELLQKLLTKLGPEKIVISVDHKDGLIVTHGWQSTTDISLIDSMNEFLHVGFTEFLLTNVNRDGTLQGPDLEFLKQACDLEKANVIASGGISNINDISKVKENNAWGVILGKALYENKITIE
ncbi:MAG: 1-(5-phosphoribosyl)-5-[(5-phosphoribosylamino)methylideneamino]imidazole-4-carboxamide isomerase, partial [Candidatus Nitrosopumilus limneticus]|nr:1-(5-phosphoribosyl)-5-[(5-phosphoribosylamino)methylideneamino]imidazole-4-carboxamide isomerase [Candidatus Nitrosopumilus limneticus]